MKQTLLPLRRASQKRPGGTCFMCNTAPPATPVLPCAPASRRPWPPHSWLRHALPSLVTHSMGKQRRPLRPTSVGRLWLGGLSTLAATERPHGLQEMQKCKGSPRKIKWLDSVSLFLWTTNCSHSLDGWVPLTSTVGSTLSSSWYSPLCLCTLGV